LGRTIDGLRWDHLTSKIFANVSADLIFGVGLTLGTLDSDMT
jgi:hypothetical protein